MSNILIDIAAEFTGKNAFKQADSATTKLYNTTKKLAASFGVAFGARAVTQFGKASVKAFIQDDNAARSLGVTLKNLGLDYGNTATSVNDFISNLERQTGVLDDELRPAMDRLLRATGSVAKAQDLLALGLDISAGTGKDLTAVSQGLQKAFLGNNASLGRLGVGLSKAELTASSFAEIQVKLTKLFAGQASSAAESYAGQINKLTVASNNAKEAIGKGIIDALKMLGDNTSASDLATDLEDAATNVANLIRGMGVLLSQLDRLPGGFKLDVAMIPIIGTYLSLITEAGAKVERIAQVGAQRNPIQSGSYLKKPLVDKTAVAALSAQKKAAKAAADAAAKKAIADKKSADLAKAAAAFDLTRISIAAALKATYDNDTKLRLLAMQAIEDEDGTRALSYLNQLKILQDSVQAAKLAGITTISNASLEALQFLLFKELSVIDASSMAEDDKNAAKDAAFAKFNDAITKQGGLAAANQYDERVQVKLTEIAKLAALQGYGSALATLNTIMVSNELAIAKTQSANDLARYDALKAYIALLGVAYDAARALAAANAAAAVIVPKVPNVPYVPKPVPKGVLPDYLDDPVIPPYVPRPVPRGVLPDYLDISTSIGSMANGTNNGGSSSNTVKIEIVDKTSGLIEVVQQAVQTNNRYGNNLDYAGAI